MSFQYSHEKQACISRFLHMALFALVSTGGLFPDNPASAQDRHDDSESTVTDSQLADARCVSGMEKFLPGTYFYCLASQNYGEHHFGYAQRFFQEAASWGEKPAQYVLAVMALNGDHQPVDRPLAFAWLTLAAERGTKRFQKPHQDLGKSLSPDELAKAGKLLEGMNRYRDAIAMPRAEKRYADGMASLHGTTTYCMGGMFDFGALANVDGSPQNMAQIAAHCPQTEQMKEKINEVAVDVFEDWHGHVAVGAPQQVPPSGTLKSK